MRFRKYVVWFCSTFPPFLCSRVEEGESEAATTCRADSAEDYLAYNTVVSVLEKWSWVNWLKLVCCFWVELSESLGKRCVVLVCGTQVFLLSKLDHWLYYCYYSSSVCVEYQKVSCFLLCSTLSQRKIIEVMGKRKWG